MAKLLEGNKLQLEDGTVIGLDEVDGGYLRQADYTRKLQALPKQDDAEVVALRAEAQRAAQWDSWYRDNNIEATLQNPQGGGSRSAAADDGGSGDEGKLMTEIASLRDTIKTLETGGRGQIQELRQNNLKLENALRYSRKIDTIRRQHEREYPDIPFEEQKILEAASKLGRAVTESDFDTIHNEVYKEPFTNKLVEKRIEERMKADKEKEIASRTADGGSSSARVFKLPDAKTPDTSDVQGGAIETLRAEMGKRGE
jgi:hypothetical protein